MLFICILFLLIVTIFLLYYFNKKQVIIRTLRKLPSSKISGIKTNQFSKITGKALHVKDPLIAPLSKRPCVFYKIQIEERRNSGNNSYWKTILKEEKTQPFFIDQNGEYIMVQPSQSPKNYKSYLVIDKKASRGYFKESTPEFETLLKSYNISTKSFFGFKKTLRYKEAILEIGEEITVAGIAKWKTLNQPIEGYPYTKIASLEHSDEQKIIITDAPKKVIHKIK
jgi:hypothetical protein